MINRQLGTGKYKEQALRLSLLIRSVQ